MRKFNSPCWGEILLESIFLGADIELKNNIMKRFLNVRVNYVLILNLRDHVLMKLEKLQKLDKAILPS